MNIEKLEILKVLIQSACSTGEISVEDKEYLWLKAKDLGLNNNDFELLVKSEFKKHSSKEFDKSTESGFINSESSKTELSSGFVVPHVSENTENNNKNKIKFTNVSTLSTQGAMSLVQKGKFQGKWVIIKRIKSQFRNDAYYRDLFYKEFENAYHLEHPHIVGLIAKGEDAESPYYFMDYVDGRTLSKIIKNKSFDANLLKNINLQILDALQYVHKKQIYHRDLKPDNIMLTYKGDNVKILDFGLAAADNFDDYLVKAGTAKYSAPEQKNKANTVDQRADIYSFGLILLEILTGTTNFDDISKIESKTYKKIIRKCINERPSDRYNNCNEIIDIIKSSKIEDLSIKLIEPSNDDNIDKEEQDNKKPKLWIWILISVIIIGLILILFKNKIITSSNSKNPNDTTINKIDQIDSSEIIAPKFSVNASSTLDSDVDKSYEAENIIDMDYSTSWIEGKKKIGEERWVVIKFNSQYKVSSITVRSCKSGKYSKIARAQLVHKNAFDIISLKNTADAQKIKLKIPIYTNYIMIKIEEVYPGQKRNLCISEIEIELE